MKARGRGGTGVWRTGKMQDRAREKRETQKRVEYDDNGVGGRLTLQISSS